MSPDDHFPRVALALVAHLRATIKPSDGGQWCQMAPGDAAKAENMCKHLEAQARKMGASYPQDNDRLIALLKSAKCGSRVLDAEIDSIALDYGWREEQVGAGRMPDYTTSLDAALTLVPKECNYIKFVSGAYVCGWQLGEIEASEIYIRGEGATDGLFALALCIAVLRARSAVVPSAPTTEEADR